MWSKYKARSGWGDWAVKLINNKKAFPIVLPGMLLAFFGVILSRRLLVLHPDSSLNR